MSVLPPPPSLHLPPPRRQGHRTLLIVLAALIALATVCSVCGLLAWRQSTKGYPVTLDTTTIPGYVESTTDVAKDASDQLRAAAKEIPFDSSFGGAYQELDGGPADLLLLFGGTKYMFSPAGDLREMERGIAAGAEAELTFVSVDPGPLGGEMRCGSMTIEGMITSVCAWADRGSLVVGMFIGLRVDEAHERLLRIRAAVEVR